MIMGGLVGNGFVFCCWLFDFHGEPSEMDNILS